MLITSLPAFGSLVVNGTPLTLVGTGIFVSAATIASGGLVYRPGGGNGSPYASFGFRVKDDGGTANGGINSDLTVRTMTINITPVNLAPVGIDNTVSTLKNTSFVFAPADFKFTDPFNAPPNVLTAVKITALPALGSLLLNGVPVSVNALINVSDIVNGLLAFVPGTDDTGVRSRLVSPKLQSSI